MYLGFIVAFCLGVWLLGKLTDKFEEMISF